MATVRRTAARTVALLVEVQDAPDEAAGDWPRGFAIAATPRIPAEYADSILVGQDLVSRYVYSVDPEAVDKEFRRLGESGSGSPGYLRSLGQGVGTITLTLSYAPTPVITQAHSIHRAPAIASTRPV